MNFRSLILLLLLAVSIMVCAQTPSVAPPPNLDVYANFVGDWVGTVQQLDHGVIGTTPVELRVTESRKKDSMRFDYKFGRKVENHFVDISRVITLNPETSKVTSLYKGGNDKYLFLSTRDKFGWKDIHANGRVYIRPQNRECSRSRYETSFD
jgi:hypothetical protein